MSRRGARRSALFALYKWDLTGTLELEPDADEYTRETVDAVQRDAAELDARITASAEGWTADRLGVVERNVLRIAIHELETGAAPVEVSIDEAVTLAKRYASEDAGRLVNGILARVANGGGQRNLLSQGLCGGAAKPRLGRGVIRCDVKCAKREAESAGP